MNHINITTKFFPLDNIFFVNYNITVIYNSVIRRVHIINEKLTTLERIHQAAKAEFLEKGYKGASLRNIVKSVGMTTGAFYGYYKSKEELFEALVGEHYQYILTCLRRRSSNLPNFHTNSSRKL